MATRPKVLKVGVASTDFIKARMIAIARGRHKRMAGEPLVWFTSINSLAQVLSEQNRKLLDLIRQAKPSALSELAALSGRSPGNLSRTLKTMENFKLVRLEKSGRSMRPVVDWDRLDIEVPLAQAA